MLKSQKLQLAMSEKRRAINEMSGSEEYKVEELDVLNKEYMDLEVQYSSALISESDEQAQTPTDDLDAEGKEVRGLEQRINMANYMSAVVEESALVGAEAEYEAATELSGVGIQVPWAALLSPKERAEMYAVTAAPSTADVNANEVLGRVFGDGAGAYLGVRMPGVPVGASNYPVLSAGVAPANAADSGAANQTAATLTANVLDPIRLTAEYLIRLVDVYKFRQMEEALRNDLAGAMREAMDAQIVAGNGTAPNVSGFVTELTDPDNPTAVAAFADYASARAQQVDGKYAQSEDDVRILVGAATYAHAAGIYQSGSGVSAISRMNPRVSPHIPAASSDIQKAIASRSMGRAVAPMWPSIALIRDVSSGASKGEIRITAIALWNFKVLDESGFAQLEFKLA